MPELRAAPTIAVIVPTFKHPVLLTEAIESVLAQQSVHTIGTVVVSDGCPLRETEAVCAAYSCAYASVTYLRKANGGPGSARNVGVEFVLANWKHVEAVFFLDADNRLSPHALETAFKELANSPPEVGWVYTNVDSFGMPWSAHLTVPYSPLAHVTMANICDTGSLVSRRVFERGVRFDEDARTGFEDWDFWLRCIENGFIGKPVSFGLAYRQRPESRNQENMRNGTAIVSHLRNQHRKLSSPQTLLDWEHHTNPRYLYNANEDRGPIYQAFTDPGERGNAIDLNELEEVFWSNFHAPDENWLAPFFAWGDPSIRSELGNSKILQNTFLVMERCAGTFNFAALRFLNSERTISVEISVHDNSSPLDDVVMWMCQTRIVREVVQDPDMDWVRSLRTATPMPSIAVITVCAPYSPDFASAIGRSKPLDYMLDTVQLLKSSKYFAANRSRWIWRAQRFPGRDEYYKQVCDHLNIEGLMPRLSKGALNVGLVVPFASFGGAEKVAYALAKTLAKNRVRVHLFVIGDSHATIIDEFYPSFTSINILAEKEFPLWGGPATVFGQSSCLPDTPAIKPKQMGGFLAGLDLVVNCHSAPMNPLMGHLRALSVKTATYLHVADISPHGRPVGHTYLTVPFEHAYDLMLTCSRVLKSDLHSLGVPEEKILAIPNAATFELKPEQREHVRAQRRQARKGRRLRVIYMGRLDRQKGIDRLLEIASVLKRRSSAVEIRIVGSALLDSDEDWETKLSSLGVQVEKPVYDTHDLVNAYMWADVLVLPSRWEGAPLVIPECQQLGCIPIVANVGAVRELIDHSVDGVLVEATNEQEVVSQFCDWIDLLSGNDRLRRELSLEAMLRGAAANWDASFEPLLAWLKAAFSSAFPEETLPAARGAQQTPLSVKAVTQLEPKLLARGMHVIQQPEAKGGIAGAF